MNRRHSAEELTRLLRKQKIQSQLAHMPVTTNLGKPLSPSPKGLALINGTQMITSLGCEAVERASAIARQADIVAALTLEVLKGTTKAFDTGQPGSYVCLLFIQTKLGAAGGGRGSRSLDTGREGMEAREAEHSSACVFQVLRPLHPRYATRGP